MTQNDNPTLAGGAASVQQHVGASLKASAVELSPDQARTLAASAGDHRVAVMREVRRLLHDNEGNQLKAVEAGLDRLAQDGLITRRDHSDLGKICAYVFAAQMRDDSQEAAASKVQAVYDGMLVSSTSSAVALAIASIASSRPAAPRVERDAASESTEARISRSDKVDTGIVGGAVAGAVIGGAIGGPGGAIIGSVVGGIAAGVGTACAT